MQIINTAIDDNPHYFNCLKAFLMSMKVNSPDQKVKVILINCPKEYESVIKRIYPAEVLVLTDPSQSAYQRNYVRHYMLLEAFKSHSKAAWIDNDALIRGDLREGFWDDVDRTTIKVWLRKKKPDEYKFQGGVYILGNSQKSIDYLGGIIRALDETDDWLLPQKLIYTLHKEYGLKHVQLSQKYNDSKFRDGSIIWHCKQSHFDNEEYQEEFYHYLKKANKYE